MSDRQGVLPAISNPVAGNHNELYNIEVQFDLLTGTLEQANIQVDNLFKMPILVLIQRNLDYVIRKKK